MRKGSVTVLDVRHRAFGDALLDRVLIRSGPGVEDVAKEAGRHRTRGDCRLGYLTVFIGRGATGHRGVGRYGREDELEPVGIAPVIALRLARPKWRADADLFVNKVAHVVDVLGFVLNLHALAINRNVDGALLGIRIGVIGRNG